ncbi:MAG: pitrilysin family protein [Bacteroidota bacterium]
MKKFRIILSLFLMSAVVMSAQTDITKRPDPVPGKKFIFPKYSEVKLKNGLKVFVIEDHEQPTITMRLQVNSGETSDRKLGTADLTANLLTKGGDRRNALQIAEALDGVGASLGASAIGDLTTVTASSLKKHMPLLLDIFSDVVITPSFPDEEREKIMPQIIGGIKTGKTNAVELAQSMARKALYGENHPYALKKTEESVNSITIDDIRDFHKNFYRPNNATLAIVGDVTAKEIVPLLEKALSNWKPASIPPVAIGKPKAMPRGVYFIRRPGAVQSAVMVTAPAVPYNSEDYETLSLLSSYFGSGFGGRLFRTLRETHSYTYTPFGFMSRAKLMNRFVAGAEVRNAVTDSAINVILKEFAEVNTNPPPAKDLSLIKSSDIGEYLLSFEQPEFLATLLQSADFNGISLEKMKGYPQRLAAMNSEDMRMISRKYISPEQLYVIVVGNPDVMESVKQFGPIYEYNLDLQPMDKVSMEKVNMSAPEIFDRYAEAVGGKSKINSINSLITNSNVTFSMSGQSKSGTAIVKQTSGGKMMRELNVPMVIQQNMWVSDGKAWMSQQGSPVMAQEGDDLRKAIFEGTLLAEVRALELGHTAEPIGKKNGEIWVKVLSPSQEEQSYVFDEKSFLLKRIESLQDMGQGPMPMIQKFEDYMDVNGIRLPKTMKTETSMFTVTFDNAYQMNTPIPDEFTPPANK